MQIVINVPEFYLSKLNEYVNETTVDNSTEYIEAVVRDHIDAMWRARRDKDDNKKI